MEIKKQNRNNAKSDLISKSNTNLSKELSSDPYSQSQLKNKMIDIDFLSKESVI